MDVATICIGIWARSQSILAAKFGSLCDSQCMMMWGMVKGCHVADGFIRHSVCCFHQHNCLQVAQEVHSDGAMKCGQVHFIGDERVLQYLTSCAIVTPLSCLFLYHLNILYE